MKQTSGRTSLGKCMLIGGGIALVLISIFLMGVKNPDPSWHKLWMLKPLIMVPFSGAVGGAFYYLTASLRMQGGWKKMAAIIISLLVYVVGLWLGSVLGLNGTLWD